MGISSFTGTETFEVLKHFIQDELMSSCYLLDTIQWTGNMEMSKKCSRINVLHEDIVFWLRRLDNQGKEPERHQFIPSTMLAFKVEN